MLTFLLIYLFTCVSEKVKTFLHNLLMRAQQQLNSKLSFNLSFPLVGPLSTRCADVPLMERMTVLLLSATNMYPLNPSSSGSHPTGARYGCPNLMSACENATLEGQKKNARYPTHPSLTQHKHL